MKKPEFSDFAVDVKADALLARLAGGKLLIMGNDRPFTCDLPITDQIRLAEIALPSPAFGPSVGGQTTMETVQPAPGLADGTPTWFRFVTAQGIACFDGDIPEHMDLGEEPVQQDGEVWVEAFVYQESKR